jgi:uncharacterized protein YyaL (SSP411 family)
MDETTYSNQGVIELINNEYVPVRVDNDVRPDINQRYNMGGWPTTAFLTSSGEILTGGTYMPAEQMADALAKVAAYYRTHRADIASRVLEGRRRSGLNVARSAGELDSGTVDQVLEAVTNAFDPEFGGFGPAPKFPQTDALLLLLEQAQLRSDPELRKMAAFTLERMVEGGTYDHVEGGFFRYSTTQDWSIPHFEKMLEDHSGLVTALAVAGLTAVLDDTTRYLDGVLRDGTTGLYAGSQDADEDYYALDAAGRQKLAAPFVDRRIYTAWNAALAVAYLEAAVRNARPTLRDEAAELLDRLFEERYRKGEGLYHADGTGGQLGDQVWGLLAAERAYQAGLGTRWLEVATELVEHLESRYGDPPRGGYLDHAGGEELGRLRDPIKPLAENSIAAIALLELDALQGDPEQPNQNRARRVLESVAGLPRQYGLMAAVFARALDRLGQVVKVSTGNAGLATAARIAHPYTVIEPSSDQRAVVCIGTICLAPVSTADAIREAIQEARQTRA